MLEAFDQLNGRITPVGRGGEQPESNVNVLHCPYWAVAISMAHPPPHPLNAEALRPFKGWNEVAADGRGIYDYDLGQSPSWFAMAEKVK